MSTEQEGLPEDTSDYTNTDPNARRYNRTGVSGEQAERLLDRIERDEVRSVHIKRWCLIAFIIVVVVSGFIYGFTR